MSPYQRHKNAELDKRQNRTTASSSHFLRSFGEQLRQFSFPVIPANVIRRSRVPSTETVASPLFTRVTQRYSALKFITAGSLRVSKKPAFVARNDNDNTLHPFFSVRREAGPRRRPLSERVARRQCWTARMRRMKWRARSWRDRSAILHVRPIARDWPVPCAPGGVPVTLTAGNRGPVGLRVWDRGDGGGATPRLRVARWRLFRRCSLINVHVGAQYWPSLHYPVCNFGFDGMRCLLFFVIDDIMGKWTRVSVDFFPGGGNFGVTVMKNIVMKKRVVCLLFFKLILQCQFN